MTETEARLILDVRISRFDHAQDVNEALEIAKQALEEIQQYRAIGTVNDIKRVIEIYSKPEELITDTLNELYSYRKIGTVEECRAAVEKQKPKKPVKRSFIIPYKGIDVCPNCKEPISKKEHHCKCGQAIDWEKSGVHTKRNSGMDR